MEKKQKALSPDRVPAVQPKPGAPEHVISREISRGCATGRDPAKLGPIGAHFICQRTFP
jgi:hypothetical protein